MKIKNLKDKPLLAEPGEEEWWRVRTTDEERIFKHLRDWRKERVSNILTRTPAAELIFYIKRLGLQVEANLEDQDELTFCLKTFRDGLSSTLQVVAGYGLGELLLWGRTMGMPLDLNKDDRSKLRKRLGEFRKIDDGLMAARQLQVMWELGIDEAVTDKDRSDIRDALKLKREEIRGAEIAEIHFLMRELNIHEDVTDADRKAMKVYFDHSRRMGWGGSIAVMAYWLGQLMPQQEETDQVPPLKEFRK